jgi:hypothetical protein
MSDSDRKVSGEWLEREPAGREKRRLGFEKRGGAAADSSGALATAVTETRGQLGASFPC